MNEDELRHDPNKNIHLTAKILAGIKSRLKDPTPEAIATLYNGLSYGRIAGYGLGVPGRSLAILPHRKIDQSICVDRSVKKSKRIIAVERGIELPITSYDLIGNRLEDGAASRAKPSRGSIGYSENI